MGFLDRLLKRRRTRKPAPPAQQRRYPSRSHIDEKDLTTVADFERRYPLPPGFRYQERSKGDFVVIRDTDGVVFVFLLEEGILAFDEPRQKQDGTVRYETTEVMRVPPL